MPLPPLNQAIGPFQCLLLFWLFECSNIRFHLRKSMVYACADGLLSLILILFAPGVIGADSGASAGSSLVLRFPFIEVSVYYLPDPLPAPGP